MTPLGSTALLYAAAAFAEIAGCFAFWAWLRLGKSAWWTLPGIISLLIFALLLTRIDSDAAGRAFAAYGGVYIAASLLWLWSMEGIRPDRWDFHRRIDLSGRGRIDPFRTRPDVIMKGK